MDRDQAGSSKGQGLCPQMVEMGAEGGGDWKEETWRQPLHQAGVLRESLQVPHEVAGLTAAGIQEDAIERKSVNREAWETGREKGKTTPKRDRESHGNKTEKKLEAATLQQDHPSTLHHNLSC